MALQIRRGTEAQRAALTGVDVPVLGELLYTTDTKKLYVGDGVTGGGTGVGYFSSVAVSGQDTIVSTGATGALTFDAGTNITLTTNDNTNTLTINAASFAGGTIGDLVVGETFSATPTDSSLEIEGFGDRMIRMVSNMSSFATTASPSVQMAAYRVTPANNNAGPKLEFRQSTTVSPQSVIAGIKSVVTNIATGSEAGKLVFDVINSPAVVSIDSTGFVGDLTGDVTGNTTGYHTGDVKGSVFADDSTVIVDGVSGKLFGDLTGNVTGNITGNVTGFITGDVKGSVFADDSTVLVDGPSGVLRGEHIGILTGDVYGRLLTTKLEIVNDSITSRSGNDSIFMNPAGTGSVNISSNLITNGIQIFGPSTGGASGDGSIFIGTDSSTSIPINIVESHNTAVSLTSISLARSRGSLSLPSVVQNNDSIKSIVFSGHDGTTYQYSSSIAAFVDGTVGSNYVPGRLEIATAAPGNIPTTRLTIGSQSVASTVPFKLPVYANDTARAAGIASPTQGMMIFMQSGTTPPATNQMQVFNGTAWISL